MVSSMTPQHIDAPAVLQGVALVCLVWSVFIFLVQAVGILQLFRYFSSPPPKPVSPTLRKDEVPHITIIRPVKGWEDGWYDCLAATFRQDYPRDKTTIYLCVDSTADPSYPFLQRLVQEFPDWDSEILIEQSDPVLHGSGGKVDNLGPNPKIRNISRAYREAKGDIIWIVDANVWISRGVAGRMVDKLCGFRPHGQRVRPFKFVHQLPLVTDIPRATTTTTSSSPPSSAPSPSSWWGGRLDEMFMSTTHAKFYSAINTVGVAPCIVGKSNMFRKSHLETFTDPSQNPLLSSSASVRGRGIDFFSSYICEDHLIGELLWRSYLPGFFNHGLVFGDLAIQPTCRMSASDYVARRVRWLRVRKWTVTLATLVEPGVESLLCCAYFSFAVTTLPWFRPYVPGTWTAMAGVWVLFVTMWMLMDRLVSSLLLRCRSVEVDENTPSFARGVGRQAGLPPRPFLSWLATWIGRETLALPIWIWAVLLGTTVEWRGKKFSVRMDMRVVEIPTGGEAEPPETVPLVNGSGAGRRSKDRVE
ncbi:Glycosyltransferase family 21 protein [Coniochaeta hoffmannii]|uniref:Ceramide glucosyltransferase n=1 Tax=Coniochaeta hoffmannii TaxID=91930 RepID=A0AA38VZA3_9PEZI|nr:Glycosyltransferase family 21 protein [Coniochaeta hoffmannii]